MLFQKLLPQMLDAFYDSGENGFTPVTTGGSAWDKGKHLSPQAHSVAL